MPEGSVSNKMIICIDIGNTNIKYAIYEGETLCISFRVATDLKKTSDEYGSQLVNMLKVREIKRDGITAGLSRRSYHPSIIRSSACVISISE